MSDYQAGITEPSLPERLVDPDEKYPATLDQAARDELVHLWGDLASARYYAARGVWSVRCENITYRLVALTRTIGAAPWAAVDMELVRSGLYERIHQEAGIDYPPVDWEKFNHHYERRSG